MAGIKTIDSRHQSGRPARGKYKVIPGCETNGWNGKARFLARCAQEGCGNEATTARCTAVEVPKQLRLMGWTKTGVTSDALWWCMVHRQVHGR